MSDFGIKLGRLITAKREEKGWSFAQTAVAVYGDDCAGGEKRKGDIQRLEQGKSKKPNAATLKKLRDGLGITQDEIDACRAPGEVELAHYADKLFGVILSAAKQLDLSESFAAELAERYAEGNPADFDAALRGLERALEVAAKEKQRGALPGNTDDAVNAVIEKVDALNAEGEIDEAAALIAEEEARAEAGLIRLYDKGIAQAILTRDVAAAVGYELKKLPRDVPDPAAQFDALRAVFKAWWDRGRDKGLNFDLEVAVALGKAMFARAFSSIQRGDGLNCEAVAMQVLAERDPNRSLDEVVEIKRRVLDHWTRRDHPQEWAIAQSNLGVTLRTLGERESGTEKLDEAATAHREALKEYTRERAPLDWAMTQMNLGNALQTLGTRETGTAKLDEAVTAYREALKERTRERVPLKWAVTQMNLGAALRKLGSRELGTERMEEAVTAYREALKEFTRDRLPLDWARTQMNLGIALFTLGARETGTERLEEAVEAYHEALKERTRDRVPLDWANTIGNQGRALMVLAERKGDADIARQALEQLTEAESVLREGGHFAWAKTFENAIPDAQALIDKLTSGDKS